MNDACDVKKDVAERLSLIGSKLFSLWSDRFCGRVLTASDQRRERIASVLFATMTAEEFVRIGHLVVAKILYGPTLERSFSTLKRLAVGLLGALQAGLHDASMKTLHPLLPKLQETVQVLNDIVESAPWYTEEGKKVPLLGNESFVRYMTDLLKTAKRVARTTGLENDEQARQIVRLIEQTEKLLSRKPAGNGSVSWEDVEL